MFNKFLKKASSVDELADLLISDWGENNFRKKIESLIKDYISADVCFRIHGNKKEADLIMPEKDREYLKSYYNKYKSSLATVYGDDKEIALELANWIFSKKY